jgi:hypothetical protein
MLMAGNAWLLALNFLYASDAEDAVAALNPPQTADRKG